MSKISNVPQIRFKGFTDDWEQRRLGEFGISTGGTSIESEFVDDGDYKVISIGSYSETSQYTDQGLRVNKTSKTSSRILNKNDLTMILNDKTSSGKIIGRVLIINEDDSYVYNQRTQRIEVNKEYFSPIFLYQYLNADNIRSKIIRAAQGNTQIYVNWTTISEIEYTIPINKREQEKIANYCKSLDTLITLHQRKYEYVVNFKKAMLEKMFPKDGSDIPEIRFKEFNQKDINAWEKKNFGDMVDFFSGLTYTPDDVKKEGTLVLRSSNVKNGEIVSADNVFVDPEVVNSKNVQSGDVIVVVRNGSRDLIGKHAQIKKDMPNTVIGAFMTGIRSERPDFISAILDTDIFDKEISKNMGATINQITGKMFMEMNFVIPSEEEQIKIGMFFRKLDDLILLYYQKLQNLKHIKKAMLEKMFV